MLVYKVYPRFGDSDQLGHIHHLAIASWFEEARNPIFRLVNPEFKMDNWNSILARLEMEYVGQIHFADQDVEIHTWISHIGTSSFHIIHGAYLRGKYVAFGGVVIVNYDFGKQKPLPISDDLRAKLEEHFEPTPPYRLSPRRGEKVKE